MKITGEARLLLVMGLAVLLGGGAMVLVNKAPASINPMPPATPPPPIKWTTERFDQLVKQARHVRGETKSPTITIVEFGDLECPSCRRAYNLLLTKIDNYPGVKFVFQNLPLDMHPHAMSAAVAMEAAANQGKYWPMFDALYTGEKTELSPEYFNEAAAKIGLNTSKFTNDISDTAVAGKVVADEDVAKEFHIAETPTFVIRDEKTGQISQGSGGKALDERVSQITGRPRILPPDTK